MLIHTKWVVKYIFIEGKKIKYILNLVKVSFEFFSI